MKILNKEETEKLNLSRYRVNTKLWDNIAQLKEGESLVIAKEEWTNKGNPNTAVPSMTKMTKREGYANSPRGRALVGKKMSVRELADKSGWAVIRLK